jgi:hypothetical protein
VTCVLGHPEGSCDGRCGLGGVVRWRVRGRYREGRLIGVNRDGSLDIDAFEPGTQRRTVRARKALTRDAVQLETTGPLGGHRWTPLDIDLAR